MRTKTAIATAYGQDVADVEEYQHGRWKPAIYQVGDALVCLTKTETPPKHQTETLGTWKRSQEWFTRMYGKFIWELS